MAAWDRQEGEPPKAYHHFTIYRDLGPSRTLAKVGNTCGVSASLCEQESAAWNWVSRCDQWDAHVQHTIDMAFLKECEKLARQRTVAFSALLGKSLEALRLIDLKKARLGEIATAMKAAAEGMRLETGLVTARHEALLLKKVANDLDQMTDEELIELAWSGMTGRIEAVYGRESPTEGSVALGVADEDERRSGGDPSGNLRAHSVSPS